MCKHSAQFTQFSVISSCIGTFSLSSRNFFSFHLITFPSILTSSSSIAFVTNCWVYYIFFPVKCFMPWLFFFLDFFVCAFLSFFSFYFFFFFLGWSNISLCVSWQWYRIVQNFKEIKVVICLFFCKWPYFVI